MEQEHSIGVLCQSQCLVHRRITSPETPTTSPLNKGPSQVAHWDTPLPKNSSSPGIPNFLE